MAENEATLINMALIDAQRPAEYWAGLERGDRNVESHRLVRARFLGAKCARCNAVNWQLRDKPCPPTAVGAV